MGDITKEQLLDAFEYKDGKLFWNINVSRKVRIGREINTINKQGYIQFKFNGKHMYAHRAIFLMHHGFLPKSIDHINCNKLDNRIENLRESTTSQNGQNTFIRINNTSGIKGIYWCNKKNKWHARIKLDYKNIHIGYFNSIEEAIPILNLARKKYHGEYSNNG